MNSKKARLFLQFGRITEDFHVLCHSIKRMLPIAFENRVKKSLRQVNSKSNLMILANFVYIVYRRLHNFVCRAENELETNLRQLQLPIKERQIRQSQDFELLERTAELSKTEHIKHIDCELKHKITDLVYQVSRHLQSEKGRDEVLKWKKSSLPAEQQEFYDDKNVQAFILQRVCEAICKLEGFKQLCQWANTSLADDATKALKMLNILNLDINYGNTCPGIVSVTKNSLEDTDGWTAVKITGAIVAMPFILASAPIILAVAGPIVAAVKLVKSLQKANFKVAVAKAYDGLLNDYLADDSGQLNKMVSSLLESSCTSVKVVFRVFPEELGKIHQKLIARVKQEEADIPKYKELLHECRKLNGELSNFDLHLNIHTFTSTDLKWSPKQQEIASGSFGAVYKVLVTGIGELAVKVMIEPITAQNAASFKEELDICR